MPRNTAGMVFKRDHQGHHVPRKHEKNIPGRWYAQYFHDGKRVCHALGKGVTKREAAEEKLALLLRPYSAADEVERRREALNALAAAESAAEEARQQRLRVPLEEVWSRFPLTENVRGKARRQLSADVIKDNERCWDKFTAYLKSLYKDLTHVQDLTPEQGRAYSKYLRQNRRVSAHRHNVIVQTLRNICRMAGMEGPRNPFASVSQYAVTVETREPLTIDELLRVCRSATGELRLLLAFGIFTGMRLGDCVLLCWDDIDFLLGVIKKKTSKSAKLAVIPLHPDLRMLLEETPSEQRHGEILPDLAGRYRRDRPSVSRMVGQHFRDQKIVTTGKVTPGQKLARRLRGFHSLRASVASLAVRAGASAEQVAQVLGNTTQVSRDHYIQLGTEAGRKVIEALPSGLLLPGTPRESPAAGVRTIAPVTPEKLESLVTLLTEMTPKNWGKNRKLALDVLGLADDTAGKK